MTQVPDPDGTLVDAPGGAVWRDDTGRRARLGGGVYVLSAQIMSPATNTQYQLGNAGGLATVCEPPNGWSKVTGYRLQLLSAAGLPVSSLGASEPHLEVRRVLSPGSPSIDLTLSGYNPATGYTGNVGDLRGISGPIRLNVMFLEAVPDSLQWVQLTLQIGASTV